jgi:hypothetical protein
MFVTQDARPFKYYAATISLEFRLTDPADSVCLEILRAM